ncbi:MAG: dihydroorotate dehydrogenase [Chloroflexi bacterium]|nr:dihydroorotate dehydrogenase [Chloroflexota bacterium]MQC48257.1 dihydroorotate dehydrogenase [Chloroflexota bacterium]
MNLAVNLAPQHKSELLLRNPVMTAAGAFGTGIELAPHFNVDGLGAVVTRTFSLRPQRGHASPRIIESPAGVIHSTGLPNAGVDSAVRQYAPVWARWSVPVIVSITGDTPEQYGRVANRLEGVAGVSGIEVSLSQTSAEARASRPADMAAIVREVAKTSSLPIIAKIEPGTADVRRLTESAVGAGAHAITVSGTLRAMSVDTSLGRSAHSAFLGQLSGPAVRPVAMRNVALAAAATDAPVVASGGIMCGEDVVAFVMAGASAVQIDVATFRDPEAPWRILEEFESWCTAEGVRDLDEIRGIVRFRE